MPNAAVIGPTGYTGLELIEILLSHPNIRVAYLASARQVQPRIDAEFPRLAGRLAADVAQCKPIDHRAIASSCQVAFLCLPHEAAMEHAPKLVELGVKIIDLSAAYRLRDAQVYNAAYAHPHTDPVNLQHAVYGLPELPGARARIASAKLIANPGCYPTASILPLAPLLAHKLIEPTGIIVNAASGASGAGREAKPHLTLVEAGDNFSAYGIGMHRHQPEIIQALALPAKYPPLANTLAGTSTNTPDLFGSHSPLLFVPHLLPIERGILATIYATPADSTLDTHTVMATLRKAYEHERFVVVRNEAPTLRDVQKTNAVHINARVVGGKVVLVSAIDNLIKGASGQAVQNANIMLGLPEHAGL